MDKKDVRILLVDDEPDIIEIIGYNIQKENYSVETASNGEEALIKVKEFQPHLVLLDVMMPIMDGMETCKRIRAVDAYKDILIVFFTARGEDYSQVAGFDAGADDYITKPIKPKVLLKKIEALARRIPVKKKKPTVYSFKNMIIDTSSYVVKIKGKEIDLPKKEFELLALLASKEGELFNRKVILDTIWKGVVVGNRTIDVHIRKLREKIGKKYIKTSKGVGYKFVVKED